MAERSLNYYTDFCEFKCKLKINSVIKARHESTEKQTLELLEVSPDEDNKIDKRAFCVHPVIPASNTYGHVPFSLSIVFSKIDCLSNEIKAAYEIWW